MKQLTPRDEQRVSAIADFLWQNRDPRRWPGDARVAKHIGLSWSYRSRDNSRDKLRTLTGHVVLEMAKRYPGWTFVRPGKGLWEVTYDPDRVLEITRPRRKKIISATQRTDAEMEVVRRNSTDPVQQRIAAQWSILAEIVEKIDA